MVIGFILISGEAILVHRWLPGSRNLKKSVHLCLQGLALACGIFGIWTKFHSTDGIVANFYSLHSWMGLICVSLFGAQWLMGFLSFWHRGEVRMTRIRILPRACIPRSLHIWLGSGNSRNRTSREVNLLANKWSCAETLHRIHDCKMAWDRFSSSQWHGQYQLAGSSSVFLAHFFLRLVCALPSFFQKKAPEVSWAISDPNAFDEYNGWDFVEPPVVKKKKGRRKFLVIGMSVSLAADLVLLPFSLYQKGSFGFKDKNVVLETDHVTTKGVTRGVIGRITIPFSVDSTQEEALFVLKKLEIIEDDVKADELCTRREYARWLVKANNQLERSRKHRIVPSVVLSGSTIAAFDDVSVEDPDFATIQSLAEAGIIPSKLSDKEFASLQMFPEDQAICFSPNRYFDISRKNIGFLDVRDISSEALVELFVDLRAGEQSILRRVFGQAKRFQPDKPSTKAQAAVSLTSGRMEEYIQSELAKLKAEKILRD
ncbi:hypothetical protein HAX54_017376 [Datura stramonium]|uniref:Cytochrome b561 domain-containing protein n=1 Tax=Datura stramonium TaxID=4076 RepID=A0ABS8S0J8_DATST|nr:hypothetical protein [Datura stramonium]